jgi:hypothetical protein
VAVPGSRSSVPEHVISRARDGQVGNAEVDYDVMERQAQQRNQSSL